MRKSGFLLVLMTFAMSANAQKKVLFEKFTNAFCGTCPDATILIDNLVQENSDIIWISHHKPITWMEHPLTNESSDAIWNELGINGVPQGMVDRNIYNDNIAMHRSFWSERINERLLAENAFDIGIDEIEYDPDLRDLKFRVNAEALLSDLSGPFRITAYIIEDSVIRAQSSYWSDTPGHPLEGLGDLIDHYAHRNVVRTILEDHWGTSNVVPDNPIMGEIYAHDYEYNVPFEINSENIHLVAMVSYFDEQNNYPGSVQNVTRVKLNELGIKLVDTEEIQTFDFSIGPNPASDFINVTMEEKADRLEITSIDGSLIKTIRPRSSNIKIKLNGLNAGIYFLTAERNGERAVQRFVVR